MVVSFVVTPFYNIQQDTNENGDKELKAQEKIIKIIKTNGVSCSSRETMMYLQSAEEARLRHICVYLPSCVFLNMYVCVYFPSTHVCSLYVSVSSSLLSCVTVSCGCCCCVAVPILFFHTTFFTLGLSCCCSCHFPLPTFESSYILI